MPYDCDDVDAVEAGRWREAVDAVEAMRRGGVEPSQRVYAALVRLLLRSQQVLVAANVSANLSALPPWAWSLGDGCRVSRHKPAAKLVKR